MDAAAGETCALRQALEYHRPALKCPATSGRIQADFLLPVRRSPARPARFERVTLTEVREVLPSKPDGQHIENPPPVLPDESSARRKDIPLSETRKL
jgi:hypothetical protein